MITHHACVGFVDGTPKFHIGNVDSELQHVLQAAPRCVQYSLHVSECQFRLFLDRTGERLASFERHRQLPGNEDQSVVLDPGRVMPFRLRLV